VTNEFDEKDGLNDDSLVDRYLNRQMDAAEAGTFEIRMLDDPELLERVQLIEALKQGLQEQQESLRAAPVQTAKILPFTGWLRQPLSMAASVLLAIMVLQQFMPGSDRSATNTSIGTVLLLENSRGIVPAEFRGPPPYLFQIDVGLGNQADTFEVTLHDDSNAEVLHMAGLQADTDGWIRLVVDQALAGNYQVELEWMDAQGATQGSSFPLRVTE
jgi:hypothetical protein